MAVLSPDAQVKYLCQLTFYIDSAMRARKVIGDAGIARMLKFFMARYPDCVYTGEATRLTKFSDEKARAFLLSGTTLLDKLGAYSYTTYPLLFASVSTGGLFPRDDYSDSKFTNVIMTSRVVGLDVYALLEKKEVFVKQAIFLNDAVKAGMLDKVTDDINDYLSRRLPKILESAQKSDKITAKILQELPMINMYIGMLFPTWSGMTHDVHANEEEILVPAPVKVSLDSIYQHGNLNFIPSKTLHTVMQTDMKLFNSWIATFPVLESTLTTALSGSMEIIETAIERVDTYKVDIAVRWKPKNASKTLGVVRRVIRDFATPNKDGSEDYLSGVVGKGTHEEKDVKDYISEIKKQVPRAKISMKYL